MELEGQRADFDRPPLRVMELASRESGQTLVMLLGAVFVLIFGLGVLGALGKALLGKGRHQRAADLAAVSAARSMRDDFLRLFEPAIDEHGQPNPRHLEKSEYLSRAGNAALEIASLNGADARAVEVEFPDGRSFAPLRERVRLRGRGFDPADPPRSQRFPHESEEECA